MARLARVVIPGMPHHITQRGNRRQQTFFNDGDYAAYVELLAEWSGKEGVVIWSYWAWCPTGAHCSTARCWKRSCGTFVSTRGRTAPLGDEAFRGRLDGMLGRALRPQKRGPKTKEEGN